MGKQTKTNGELIAELKELQQKYDSLKEISENVITERKQIEKALKEAEWKFRALFEKGPIGVAYQYKPDHFVAAFIEITERKRAEEKLNESEALKPYQVILPSSNFSGVDLEKIH
jgi:PAS domain-containing protein